MNCIEIENVSKTIGDERVLNNVSLTFEDSKIYVLTGENGSGKTMLMRYIAGLISADEGCMRFNGRECCFGRKREFSLGLILENVGLYNEFNLYDNLELLASINKKCTKEEILQTIVRVGLEPKSRKRVGKFSLGMKKRGMIAQAIMEKPQVLLLDEPSSGLDADGRVLLYQILKEEKERNAIVIISSHISDDIKEIADVIIGVERGRFERKTGEV